ncbi:hypothetical protein BJV77DRAFT_83453 [Russula vinacea]|nr:hypothetical protein BJV77DRAFT_83453 [Russula vinacea]
MPSPSDLVVLPHTFHAHSRDATATSLHTDPCNSSGIVDLRRHSPSPHPLHIFNPNDSIRAFLTSLLLWYSSSPLEMCHAILIPVAPTLNTRQNIYSSPLPTIRLYSSFCNREQEKE